MNQVLNSSLQFLVGAILRLRRMHSPGGSNPAPLANAIPQASPVQIVPPVPLPVNPAVLVVPTPASGSQQGPLANIEAQKELTRQAEAYKQLLRTEASQSYNQQVSRVTEEATEAANRKVASLTAELQSQPNAARNHGQQEVLAYRAEAQQFALNNTARAEEAVASLTEEAAARQQKWEAYTSHLRAEMQEENELSVKAKLEEYIVLAESNHREITTANLKRWQASLEAERSKERFEVDSIRTASERQVAELNARLAAMEQRLTNEAKEHEMRLQRQAQEEYYQRCECLKPKS